MLLLPPLRSLATADPMRMPLLLRRLALLVPASAAGPSREARAVAARSMGASMASAMGCMLARCAVRGGAQCGRVGSYEPRDWRPTTRRARIAWLVWRWRFGMGWGGVE